MFEDPLRPVSVSLGIPNGVILVGEEGGILNGTEPFEGTGRENTVLEEESLVFELVGLEGDVRHGNLSGEAIEEIGMSLVALGDTGEY